MNRAKFSLFLRALLCCLFVAALPRAGQTQELSKAAITYPAAGVAAIDLHVAQAQGIFREEGLNAQLVRLAGNPAIRALTAGEVQAVSSVASVIRAIERGKSNVPFKEAEAAKALIKFLTAPAAVPVIKANGMEPGNP